MFSRRKFFLKVGYSIKKESTLDNFYFERNELTKLVMVVLSTVNSNRACSVFLSFMNFRISSSTRKKEEKYAIGMQKGFEKLFSFLTSIFPKTNAPGTLATN